MNWKELFLKKRRCCKCAMVPALPPPSRRKAHTHHTRQKTRPLKTGAGDWLTVGIYSMRHAVKSVGGRSKGGRRLRAPTNKKKPSSVSYLQDSLARQSRPPFSLTVPEFITCAISAKNRPIHQHTPRVIIIMQPGFLCLR